MSPANRRNKGETPKLPDWYPLPIYSQRLSEKEWLSQIEVRASLTFFLKRQQKANVSEADKDALKPAFISSIVEQAYTSQERVKERSKFSSSPIRAPTVLETFFTAEMVAKQGHTQAQDTAKKLATEPLQYMHGFLYSNLFEDLEKTAMEDAMSFEAKAHERIRYRTMMNSRFQIFVDLDYDDETLKQIFEAWLRLIRAMNGVKMNMKKPIKSINLQNWRRFCVLEVFDLRYWAELSGYKYSNAYLGKTLWPNDVNIDTTERIRRTTTPLINDIFTWQMVHRLTRQIELKDQAGLQGGSNPVTGDDKAE